MSPRLRPGRDEAGGEIPRLARWLLAAATPAEERPYLLDDLAEEFDALERAHGRPRALVWCVSQVVRSFAPLVTTRLRSRVRAAVVDRAAAAHPLPPGDPMFTQLRDDLRYSLRVAARRPWLSVVVATVALGVGSTTAVFSVVDALLLRPLGFPQSERLVRLTSPMPRHP